MNFHCSPRRRSSPLVALILLVLLMSAVRTQYVFNQLAVNLPFDYSSPQVVLQANLNDTVSTKQYSLWGWFKPDISVAAISNIVQLQNVQGSTRTDLFYLNFVYQGLNKTTSRNQYSLMYLNSVGIDQASGNPNMFVQGFENLPYTGNSWVYWGVSCDYVNGYLSIHVDDKGAGPAVTKNFPLNYPGFNLYAGFNLIIASVMNNTYFQSASGFVGNIAYIDLGLFYTTTFQNLWMGFIGLDSYSDFGMISDVNFDLYSGTSGGKVKSTGINTKGYDLGGSYAPTFVTNKNKMAVDFANTGFVDLGNLDFRSSELIYSMILYYQFSYQEPLPDTFVLFERGVAGANGYMQLALIKGTGGRTLQLTTTGKTTYTWQSQMKFAPDKMYRIMSGIVVNPRNEIYNVFMDQESNTSDYSLLATDEFDKSAKTSYLLSKSASSSSVSKSGGFTLSRFSAMNSASGALANSMSSRFVTSNSTAVMDFKKCSVKTSFFGDSKGCMMAASGMTMATTRKITAYCPLGFKNGTTDVCVACQTPTCSEVETNKFQVTSLSDRSFRIQNTMRVVNFNDLAKNLKVTMIGAPPGTKFNYTIIPNEAGQYFDVNFNVDGDATGSQFVISYDGPTSTATTANGTPPYDANSNLLQGIQASYNVTSVCAMDTQTKTAMKVLGWVIVALFFASFAVLLLVTILFWSKLVDIGGLWKQFVHNVIRAQFVACLLLLGLKLPCCLKEFLNILYWIFVWWAHGLGAPINKLHGSSATYQEGYLINIIPANFSSAGAFNFFLHNMCVIFIIHLVVFVVYLVLKITDFLNFTKPGFFYRLLVFMEFTGLIVGFGLALVLAGVFSFLNFRLVAWSHSYFVMSFLIAVAYLTVFVLFKAYALYRLVITKKYLSDPIIFNALYYYFAGYRKNIAARTYDIWFYIAYFTCGAFIGALYDSPTTQIVLILITLFLLFVTTLVLRPSKYLLQTLIDVATQLILIIILAMFVALAAYERQGCLECGDRQGKFCKALVALLFCYLAILFLGLIAQTLANACCRDWYVGLGHSRRNLDQELSMVQADGGEFMAFTNQKTAERLQNESGQPLLINEFKSFNGNSKMLSQSIGVSQSNIHNVEIPHTNVVENGLHDQQVVNIQQNWDQKNIVAASTNMHAATQPISGGLGTEMATGMTGMAVGATTGKSMAQFIGELKNKRDFDATIDETLIGQDVNVVKNVFVNHIDNRQLQMKRIHDDSDISMLGAGRAGAENHTLLRDGGDEMERESAVLEALNLSMHSQNRESPQESVGRGRYQGLVAETDRGRSRSSNPRSYTIYDWNKGGTYGNEVGVTSANNQTTFSKYVAQQAAASNRITFSNPNGTENPLFARPDQASDFRGASIPMELRPVEAFRKVAYVNEKDLAAITSRDDLESSFRRDEEDSLNLKKIIMAPRVGGNVFRDENITTVGRNPIEDSSKYSIRERNERFNRLVINDNPSIDADPDPKYVVVQDGFRGGQGSTMNARNQVNIDLFGSRMEEPKFFR